MDLDFGAISLQASGLDASGLIAYAVQTAFPKEVAVVSSFGAESAVLLHLVARVDPSVPVVFLNTGKLFGETMRYRDRLQQELGLMDIRAIGPHPADRERLDPGGALWSRDPDACCHLRKVQPLARALAGFKATITGRKRFQSETRSEMSAVERDGARVRFNPLSSWSLEDLTRYIGEHKLPAHPLVADGYPSIGCLPCTRRVKAGEHYRAGRWSGFDKDECGIHTGLDGDGI